MDARVHNLAIRTISCQDALECGMQKLGELNERLQQEDDAIRIERARARFLARLEVLCDHVDHEIALAGKCGLKHHTVWSSSRGWMPVWTIFGVLRGYSGYSGPSILQDIIQALFVPNRGGCDWEFCGLHEVLQKFVDETFQGFVRVEGSYQDGAIRVAWGKPNGNEQVVAEVAEAQA